MKKFAITGNPVNHSKSPALFQAAYGSSCKMKYILMSAQSAGEAIALFNGNELCGMNVTAPFKTDILEYIDERSNEVIVIGAANTIVKTDKGQLKAYNTDYIGVSETFAEFGVHLTARRCLLLGIGGAGKAAAYAIAKAGGHLTIANRTIAKAEEFADKTEVKVVGLNQLEKVLGNFDIIVNTLYPSIDFIEKTWLHANQIVMDASYTGSPLLDKAARRGCRCIDGRYWILHQAIPAFELFTGQKPDIETMRQVLNL
ncbi:MAG: shikimate dehydrogenase [Prevotellaceae bacterium]|jgi:shikimate dehydrogenase|nr:shikimate dehydrogenase [Prevotellaceae bacterium]